VNWQFYPYLHLLLIPSSSYWICKQHSFPNWKEKKPSYFEAFFFFHLFHQHQLYPSLPSPPIQTRNQLSKKYKTSKIFFKNNLNSKSNTIQQPQQQPNSGLSTNQLTSSKPKRWMYNEIENWGELIICREIQKRKLVQRTLQSYLTSHNLATETTLNWLAICW